MNADSKAKSIALCTSVLFTVLLVVTSHQPQTISQCDNGEQYPERVRINEFNSHEIEKWQIQRGHNYSLKADFVAKTSAAKVYLQMFIRIGNKSIKLPFFRKNLCRTPSGLQCPIGTNGRYSFKLNVRIPEHTPTVPQASLRMQLINEKQVKLLCFIMPLTVTIN